MLTKGQKDFIKEKHEESIEEYGNCSSSLLCYESVLIMIMDLIGEEIECIND